METAYRPAPPPSLRATGSLCRLGPWCWTCASCPASSGDKAVGALNIEQWLHMHEDVLTRNVMVTALSYLLVSCYVKVMLSACLPVCRRRSPIHLPISQQHIHAAGWSGTLAASRCICTDREILLCKAQRLASTAISAIYRIFPATPATPLAPLHACFFPICTITWRDERYCY